MLFESSRYSGSAKTRAIAALAVTVLLSACSTTQALEPPKPEPREAPINSLALEQCIRENGPEKCTTGGE